MMMIIIIPAGRNPWKTQDTPLGILPEAPEEVRVSVRRLDGWISVKIQLTSSK